MTVTRWARAYFAAIMFNLALVGDLQSRPTRPQIGFERVFSNGTDRLDPRELIDWTVITVPLDLKGSSRSVPDLN